MTQLPVPCRSPALCLRLTHVARCPRPHAPAPQTWRTAVLKPMSGGGLMKRSQAVTAVILCMLYTVGWASLGVTGKPHGAAVMPFDGYVKAIKIDLCGLEPGQCEGAMVVAK